MAVARELQRTGTYTASVYLATGLPITWVRTQRNSFKAYLMKNTLVDFRYNGNDFHIKFVGCSIYPQCYPAIVEHIHEFKGTNILADIGNGTMNILYIQNKNLSKLNRGLKNSELINVLSVLKIPLWICTV